MARSQRYRTVRLLENRYQTLIKEWLELGYQVPFQNWIKANKGAAYRGEVDPDQDQPWTAEHKFVFRDPKQATMFVLIYA